MGGYDSVLQVGRLDNRGLMGAGGVPGSMFCRVLGCQSWEACREHGGQSSARILLPLPGRCFARYIPAEAGLELGSDHSLSKEEAEVLPSSFILGYQKGLRGYSPKGGSRMISEADVFDSVSLLMTDVNMGRSFCLSVSPSVTWRQ